MPSRRLYDLKVTLVRGPVHAGALEEEISRTIQIRGDLRLADLHDAIFDAFDREEEHMYEFVFGEDEKSGHPDRYTRGADLDAEPGRPKAAGDVAETTIASLRLKLQDQFQYAFDFGDTWVHTVQVVAFEKGSGFASSPAVIHRVGESPAQYPD